jgi:hypothetical protein
MAELASSMATTQMMCPKGCERVIQPHSVDVSSGCEPFVPTLSKGVEVVQTEMMSPRVCIRHGDMHNLSPWELDKPVRIRQGGHRIDPPDKMLIKRPLPDGAYQTQLMRTKGCDDNIDKDDGDAIGNPAAARIAM